MSIKHSKKFKFIDESVTMFDQLHQKKIFIHLLSEIKYFLIHKKIAIYTLGITFNNFFDTYLLFKSSIYLIEKLSFLILNIHYFFL